MVSEMLVEREGSVREGSVMEREGRVTEREG